MYRLLRQISHMTPRFRYLIEILGGARQWQDAAKDAQAVHASSLNSLAWKQGFIHWTTVSKSKKALTLRTLIVSVELRTLSVACLGSGMLHVISGTIRGRPARSNLITWAHSEPTQRSSAIVTYGTYAHPSWNGLPSYQEFTGITPASIDLAESTGLDPQSKLSFETRYSSILPWLDRSWIWRLFGIQPIVIDGGDDKQAILDTLAWFSSKIKPRLTLRGSLISCLTIQMSILTRLLISDIESGSNGGWRSLLKHPLMSVTILLVYTAILLEIPLSHMLKVHRIRAASKRARQGSKGDPRLSSISTTWSNIHRRHRLGSRIGFKNLFKLLRAMVECPLEKGRTRIRWQCVSRSLPRPRITGDS